MLITLLEDLVIFPVMMLKNLSDLKKLIKFSQEKYQDHGFYLCSFYFEYSLLIIK